MIIIVKDVDHVKHYGVKGQQWGVRRKTDSKGLVRTDVLYTESTKRGNAFQSLIPAILARSVATISGASPGVSLAAGAATGLASYTFLHSRSKNKVNKYTTHTYFDTGGKIRQKITRKVVNREDVGL